MINDYQINALTQKNELLLKEERTVLNDLRVALAKFGIDAKDMIALSDSIRQLDEFFLLVVVGEFNAGKSAFINALVGETVVQEGVTPTTTQVNVLRFGAEIEETIEESGIKVMTAPIEFLRNLSIVDTPGTNAVIREHEEITSDFIPRSDMVLFVTSADRPFSESERGFLQEIRDWGKKVVIVLNKVDLLESVEDLTKVKEFVLENAKKLLGDAPELYPVSARIALRAKLGNPDLWNQSLFEPLENFILAKLDEENRLKLKFLNPLGVGEYLVDRYQNITRLRINVLDEDTIVIRDVEQQLEAYAQDLTRSFELRLAGVEKTLLEMENRGQEYFDETIRIGRVTDLMKKERIQNEFELKVVGDAPDKIESRVAEMIDWLVEADLKQWQRVTEYLSKYRQKHQDRIVGGDSIGTFQYDRERLIDGVGKETRRVVEDYNKDREARELAEGVQSAVAATAVLEIGAVGLGVLVSAIATTVAVDVTGIIFAGFVAIVGFFVLPARRRMAKREMKEKVATMRIKIIRALRSQFDHEIKSSVEHIKDAIGPYTRFVESEQEKLTAMKMELDKFDNDLARLRGQIELGF